MLFVRRKQAGRTILGGSMKTDLKLSQLVSQLDYISTLKKDYLISTDDLSVHSNAAESCIDIQGSTYVMQETARRQLSALCGIPYSYVKRIGCSVTSYHKDKRIINRSRYAFNGDCISRG